MTLIYPEVYYDQQYYELVWTSDDEDILSRVFVDGKIRGSVPGEVDRKFFVSSESTINPEVQDVEASCLSIYDTSNSRPLLHWNAVSNAEIYRVYCDEEILFEIAADTSEIYYSQVPGKLDGSWGQWHSFRVEAVTTSGVESARTPWQYWIYGLPDSLSNMTIENGSASGKFTINIEE